MTDLNIGKTQDVLERKITPETIKDITLNSQYTQVELQQTEELIVRKTASELLLERENAFDKLVPKSQEELVVDELNEVHAAMMLDQFYILTEKENQIFGGIDFSLEGKRSFKDQYENKLVQCSDGKMRTKAEIWLKSPNRREYKGIIFDPTKSEKIGYYNLWRGFTRESRKGDCSKFWAHVQDNICNGDFKAYEYVRKWIAYIFQFPDEVHTALVLCGSQGVGKNSFVEPLGLLLGVHYVLLSNITELVSNFNYHLKYAVLIHANEALWGGSQKEIGCVKAMITEKTCLIEPKGKDRIALRNYKHIILSSNEDWPVHLDRDDRRFYVLRVSEQQKENYNYFAGIQKQLDAEGYEALLYDLLNEDVTNFNPRKVPHSIEAFDIKMLSASTVDQYIYEVLQEGCFDIGNESSNGIWPDVISKKSVVYDYQCWCVRNSVKPTSNPQFSKRLKRLIISIGDTKPSEEGRRISKYQMPSLENARTEFEKAYKSDNRIWKSE